MKAKRAGPHQPDADAAAPAEPLFWPTPDADGPEQASRSLPNTLNVPLKGYLDLAQRIEQAVAEGAAPSKADLARSALEQFLTPPQGNVHSLQVPLAADSLLKHRLEDHCRRNRTDAAAFVREAIEHQLNRQEESGHEPDLFAPALVITLAPADYAYFAHGCAINDRSPVETIEKWISSYVARLRDVAAASPVDVSKPNGTA